MNCLKQVFKAICVISYMKCIYYKTLLYRLFGLQTFTEEPLALLSRMDIRPVYNEAKNWQNNLHKPLPSSVHEMRIVAFMRNEVQVPLKRSST